jgi:multiple sugar transport system substrate-binding protein
MSLLTRRSTQIAIAVVVILVAVVAGYWYWNTNMRSRDLIFVTHWNSPEELAYVNQWITSYHAIHPNVNITVISVSTGELKTKIVSLIQAGTPPDIIHIYQEDLPSLADAGYLSEAPSDVATDVSQNYVPSAIGAVTYKGKMYGVPTEADNYLIVYNKAIFQQEGITPPSFDHPWTFSEFLEVCKKVAVFDSTTGELKRAAFSWWPGELNIGFIHPFAAFLASNGGDVISSDLSSVTYNSSKGLEVAQLWYDIAVRYGLWDPRFTPDSFCRGNVSMIIIAPWGKLMFSALMGPNFMDTVGIAPIPIGPSTTDNMWHTISYHWLFAVASGSKEKDTAWGFIKYINQPQTSGQRTLVGTYFNFYGILPSRKSDLEVLRVENDPWFTVYLNTIFTQNTRVLVVVPGYDNVFTPLWRNLELMINGQITPAQALSTAAQQSDQELHG